KKWKESDFLAAGVSQEAGRDSDLALRFGIIGGQGVSLAAAPGGRLGNKAPEPVKTGLVFAKTRWALQPELLRGLELNGRPLLTSRGGRARGLRFRDIDNDGQCELIVGNESQSAVFSWNGKGWTKSDFALPANTAVVDDPGRDAGLRLLDIDGDGSLDVLFADARRYSLHLFRPKADPRLNWAQGWTDEVIAQNRTD